MTSDRSPTRGVTADAPETPTKSGYVTPAKRRLDVPEFSTLTGTYCLEASERGYWPTDESAALAGRYREGNVHIVKTIQPYFGHVRAGHKTFEIRRNDRNYQPGDLLILAEWDGDYTGQDIVCRITYVLRDGEHFGVKPGYVVLGMVRRGG